MLHQLTWSNVCTEYMDMHGNVSIAGLSYITISYTEYRYGVILYL